MGGVHAFCGSEPFINCGLLLLYIGRGDGCDGCSDLNRNNGCGRRFCDGCSDLNRNNWNNCGMVVMMVFMMDYGMSSMVM